VNSAGEPRPDPIPQPVERVDKPWGHEEIFAVSPGRYVGKTMHIHQGESLSLQYHRLKHETVAVLRGRVALDVGPLDAELRRLELGPGRSFEVPAGLVHRMTALEDAVVMEVSTADPGWREDVVRLEDRYGRGGTSVP
jgi:mannose-6-phosphate isomerase